MNLRSHSGRLKEGDFAKVLKKWDYLKLDSEFFFLRETISLIDFDLVNPIYKL